jgi:very-short-patch-repair endonuclease
LEELNIGIEFDGSYWHKDKNDLDKLKTNNLKREGFEIIRIREEPLEAITEIDIVSKLPFDPKKVTNDILKYIVKEFQIENHTLEQIYKYLRKTNIQNESALNDYIESILQEKVEIKKNKKK